MDILKKIAWEQGTIDPRFNKDLVRKDACGAWIIWDHYGLDSPFGWQIDHIYPKSKLEQMGICEEKINNEINLRPLNTKNNISKSDNYPAYIAVMTSDDLQNVECNKQFLINKEKQEEIERFYGLTSQG